MSNDERRLFVLFWLNQAVVAERPRSDSPVAYGLYGMLGYVVIIRSRVAS